MSEEETKVDTNELILQRKEKLKNLRETTKDNAFPNDFKPEDFALDLTDNYIEGKKVKVAGRIMTRRLMGKASFITLQDMSGKIQAYVKQSLIPDGVYEDFKHWDIGDIVGVEGELFTTKTGEISIRASQIRLLTKSLRPLPDKWHGLADQEMRYRQRYVDLIVSDKVKETFRLRTKMIDFIRDYLKDLKYLEVETPMMQVLAGGAAARPFITHHNTLDMTLFLRIAPELYLKRLVVGGFERVFEINRNFRNEGLSTSHNPEFTMLEFYQAYASHNDMTDLTEDMLRKLAEKVLGKTTIVYQTKEIDLSKPFERLTLKESIIQKNKALTKDNIEDKKVLVQILKDKEAKIEDSWGVGKLQLEVFEKTVEDSIEEPTFITEYPLEVSPLARKNAKDNTVTDRFELFVGGYEIANGFSELNDPIDQAMRFEAQVKDKAKGDEEAMPYDQDYITALEYGMPPTAGEGIGIDRLVMLFTDSASIKEVILFPHMRPQSS